MSYRFLLLLVVIFGAYGCAESSSTDEATGMVIAEDTTAEAEAEAEAEAGAASDGEALAVLVPGSGVYSRTISTQSPQTQAFFDQGLRLAWGFFFPESIASYQEAARLDPTHPMPYWGMAHAMGPNPNSRYGRMPDDPLGEGLKAIQRAKELAANGNDYERDLIDAMYVLYDKVSIPDAQVRDQAYLDAARALHQKYPDDADVGSLYAAAYMSIGRWDYWDADGQPKSETEPVAQALEQVLQVVPGHPGANHLYIHLLEASLEPERALGAADRLEATMPVAGHVVHMPAHIYVRVGDYQKAIDNNVRSQQADQEFAKIWGDMPLPNLGTYPLNHKMHAPHAIDFIRYAATVQGNYAVAIEAAEKSASFVSEASVDRRGGQKRVAAIWLVHKTFGKWDKLIGQTPGYAGRPYLDGIWSYALGGAYAATGDLERAWAESEKLTALANSPDADTFRVGATPASAVLKLAALGLRGEILQAEGKLEEAIEAFTQAVAIEDLNNYTEPPDWSQPIRHFLGAALVAAGRFEEAEAVYRRDLRWNQNNGWSLYGLYQSLQAQGQAEAAAEVLDAFEAAWQHADVTLATSRI